MGVKRKRANQFLEPNLYKSTVKGKVYWAYRDPITKKRRGLGSDRATAVSLARQLNSIRLNPGNQVDAIVSGIENDLPQHISAGLYFGNVVDRYIEEAVPEKDWSAQTDKNMQAMMKRFKLEFGDKPLHHVNVIFLNEWLGKLTKNAYVKHRTRLIDIFKFAISKGYTKENPAEATMVKTPKVKDKLRKRLTLDTYKAIYRIAEPWMQNAMDIALITLQRGGDIVEMEYGDIKSDDSVERLYVIQNKNEKKSDKAFLAIEINSHLRAIIDRTKMDAGNCPYIIHANHKRRYKTPNKTHLNQVLRDHLTKTFSKLRDETGLFDGQDALSRPTFHEIRSLGIHLYKDVQRLGDDYTQSLAGHADLKMTDEYARGHKVEFNKVSADLDIDSLKIW